MSLGSWLGGIWGAGLDLGGHLGVGWVHFAYVQLYGSLYI